MVRRRKFRKLNNGRRGRRFNRGRRLKKFIKRVVRRMSEIKYSFAFNAAGQDAATPFIADITPTFPQGVTKNTRIGNAIKYKFLQFRATLVSLPGAVPLDQILVRSIIFQTRLPLSVVPATTDILDANNILSSIRNTNVRIIQDKSFWLGLEGPLNIESGHTSAKTIKKKARINNNVNFSAAADVLPRDPKDRYYWMFITSQGVPLNNNINYSWFSRLSFIDT